MSYRLPLCSCSSSRLSTHTIAIPEHSQLIRGWLHVPLPTSIYCQLSRLTISPTCRTQKQVAGQQSRIRVQDKGCLMFGNGSFTADRVRQRHSHAHANIGPGFAAQICVTNKRCRRHIYSRSTRSIAILAQTVGTTGLEDGYLRTKEPATKSTTVVPRANTGTAIEL